jgi:hypothetical protein
MGASRARHVKGSRRRQGSTCFRSNDGSYSVRAVFGLPPRSDRGSRRADAVAIPTALSSREDLTVIAPFRFKEYRRMRRQQGGIGRPAGLAGSRTERGDQAQIPGWSSSWERCSSSKSCRPRALRDRTSSRIACPAIEPPDDPIVYPKQPGASHLHDFFGNTTTNAFSAYAGMLAGGTNCQGPGDTAASWAPALLRKHGRSDPASHPERLSSPRRGRPMNLVVRSD